MKIVCTGGHLTPVLAIIDELPKDSEVIFIGRKYSLEGDSSLSLEYNTITERGITFIPIRAGRIQRKMTRYTLPSVIKIPIGLIEAIHILRKVKPDVVLGFGGYISVAVGLAAYLLHIPLVIHEQTLESGLANKILARFATKVCISWQQSARFFPKNKTVLTGNPVRKFPRSDFYSTGGQLPGTSYSLPLIYITGGSAGSHAVNELIKGCLDQLLQKSRVIHQTGDAQEYRDYERLSALRKTMPERLQKRYLLAKFIKPYDIGNILKEATLVISRSGMNTITELLKFGKPCLLIPLPYGQRNEQLKNAQFIKKTGIGDYLIQENISSGQLLSRVESMLENISKYIIHTRDAKTLIPDDAAARIINILYETVSKK